MTDLTDHRPRARRARRLLSALGLLAAVLFTGSPASAQSRVAGIDVSQFQGAMNWATAYNKGVRFTFIRATRGPTTGTASVNDTRTTINVPAARAAGVLAGVYHYGRPDTIAQASGQPTDTLVRTSAKDEALHFYQTAGSYMTSGYLRPVLDLEARGGDAGSGTVALTPAKLTLWATAFCDEIQRLANTMPLVYMNTNYAANYVDAGLTTKNLWIANWNETSYGDPLTGTGSPPLGAWSTAGKPWSFWQYSADGNGLGSQYGASSADIDLDAARGDITFVRSFLVPEPGSAGVVAAVGGATALGRRRRRRA